MKQRKAHKIEDFIAEINTLEKIKHHGVFSAYTEMRKLAYWCRRVRREYYSNPELAQLIIDSYVINLKDMLLATKESEKKTMWIKKQRNIDAQKFR